MQDLDVKNLVLAQESTINALGFTVQNAHILCKYSVISRVNLARAIAKETRRLVEICANEGIPPIVLEGILMDENISDSQIQDLLETM